MLVGLPAFEDFAWRPFFLFNADFTVDETVVVLRWTKKTPQSDPIPRRQVLEDAATLR